MNETPQETDAEREARQDAALAALQSQEPETPAEPEPTPAGPKLDPDGDPVYPYTVDGTFDAEDQHDAYKLLQAHFMALSRGDVGTLHGVSVAKA